MHIPTSTLLALLAMRYSISSTHSAPAGSDASSCLTAPITQTVTQTIYREVNITRTATATTTYYTTVIELPPTKTQTAGQPWVTVTAPVCGKSGIEAAGTTWYALEWATHAGCKQRCIEDTRCQSILWDSVIDNSDGMCHLYNKPVSEAGQLVEPGDMDALWYDRICL